MIKYSAQPNQYNSVKCALSAVLPVFHQKGWKDVVKGMSVLLERVWSIVPYKDADTCKQLRKAMLSDISNIIFQREIKAPIMKEWNQILDNNNVTGAAKLQLLFSFADAPKFLIHKESDLREMSKNIEQHISEINAITYYDGDGKRICPYDPAEYHDDRDIVGTIMRQKKNIVHFLLNNTDDEDERKFYKEHADLMIEKVAGQLKQIARDYEDYLNGIYKPSRLEQGFFDSLTHIRNKIGKCEDRMNDYKNGRASSDQFSQSESKSPISENKHAMRILHMLGWNKPSCPAVLSNIFYCRSLNAIGILKQAGQIEVDEELYFVPAPGLGPGYKIRWVYSIDTNINNYLTPLADLIQEADKICDLNEAYNDQLKYLLANLPLTKDAYCIDSKGFSDYLWVGIYRYLMRLYGLSEPTIDLVMRCFRLPVKIGNKLIRVEFGTFQGCKLLVFIMNHANRLMGIIADRMSVQQDCVRPNAGDDVAKLALDHKFDAEDMWTEIVVFACFNCPTNSSKSAWMSRDGYFDFCSKYFAKVGQSIQCISGVPAKKYGKEIICIADWAESYKVLHNSQQQHTDCLTAFQDALPFIKEDLEQGCKLPNVYHIPMTIQSKIQQAALIPFTYGGLASADVERDPQEMIKILRYKVSLLFSNYLFNPVGVYMVATKLKDLEDTELIKAIGSINHQSVHDLIKLTKILMSTDPITNDDLDWAKESVSKFERNAINGQSLSRTSSTYHRLERNRDVDLLFPMEAVDTDLNIPIPKDSASMLMMISILSDRKYVDVYNMRRFIFCLNVIAANPGLLVKYYGIGNCYYYGIKDPDNNKIIRIYDNDDIRYPDFEPIWSCENETIRNVVQILRESHVMNFMSIFYNSSRKLDEKVLNDMASRLIKQQISHFSEKMTKVALKKTLQHITDRFGKV